MIKIITILTKFIVTAIMALLFSSCIHNKDIEIFGKSITGSGVVTTENRNLNGDFKSIEVSNAIDLVVEQSNTKEIVVEADDNLQKEITTEVRNGVLIVGCNYNNYKNVSSRKVTVKLPIIEELQASSASTIKSIKVLKGNKISIDASSGSSVTLNLEFDNISFDASSGSDSKLEGKALKFQTSSSSGSHINAHKLMANEVIADASSGSSINVHPILKLKADASSGSSITYTTVPKVLEKSASSGGSITQD